ncbi:MAG: ATP-binding cassette domain-containing protein [Nitrospiraceae bacterium]|nr:ATP-binding cassette domain-containing protein [Nitrospiraceae bacterium]
MWTVELEGVGKRFGRLEVLRDFSLQVGRGEGVCLYGPSGCGKTTLLRLIAGLERPDQGRVSLRGAVASGEGHWIPPTARGLGMVFQDFALWPHMRVERHLSFVLASVPRSERRKRIGDLLGLCGLGEKRRAFPAELSGGERQRVGIARALATEPGILLLDEPYSNLNEAHRERINAEIARRQQLGLTVVAASHELNGVEAIAGRVMRMP